MIRRDSWKSHRLFVLLGAALTLAGVGCGDKSAESLYSQAVGDSNAKRLGALYLQYQVRNADYPMRGPSSVDEFRKFISSLEEKNLQLIGVDKTQLDDLFVSGRDNEPYEIRLEVQGVIRGPEQPVVFEKAGVDGKFIVAFTGFIEKEVDQSEYDRLMSGDADDGS